MNNEEEKLMKLRTYFGANQSSKITIESLSCLKEHLDEKEIAQIEELYKQLDTNNSNSIKLELLMKEIIKRDIVKFQQSTIDSNLKKVSNQFSTKCERIIRLLKEMKIVAMEEKDLGSVANINAIISTLNEANIYEMESNLINKNEQMSDEYKNGIGFLVQYSKMEQINAKTKDFTALLRSNRYMTITLEGNLDDEKKVKREKEALIRRRTLNASLVISPSISAKIANLMNRLPYDDFDIFALDSLITHKASFYIAKEILSTLKTISEEEIIPEAMLTSFIEKVVSSYDRKAAIYHNDLHAGDVMQTLYTMFYHGFLEEVIYYI